MPLQIWDIANFSILKFVNAIALISSIEWAEPLFSNQVTENMQESFVFVCPDGKVHCYKIENNNILQSPQSYDLNLKSVTSINLFVFIFCFFRIFLSFRF